MTRLMFNISFSESGSNNRDNVPSTKRGKIHP